MSEFSPGQRWVVDSEPELGLGMVVSVEGRSVSIFFPAGDCERRYASANAPLTRIVYQAGESIKCEDGTQVIVKNVLEENNLVIYELEDDSLIPETKLSASIQLHQPFMRLIMGQIDRRRWFYFRRALDAAMSRVWQSRLNGLLGVRASLIPHQLYVAHNACDRERVRILLADEVGLGKTIEAGMILNRLIKLERVKRALIVVPSALQVQWLVELIRRFSIMPVLYDVHEHDFHSGQVHIVPQHALAQESEALLSADFDIAIVDEAHHIVTDGPDFSVLKIIAELCPHLVLMSATPEQLGFDSHFARLQLLDSVKYNDSETLRKEEQGYEKLNILIRDLPDSRDKLIKKYNLDPSLSDDLLTQQVLDSHGIGRVMFRNTRASVSGFPQRIAMAHVLENDEKETCYEWLATFLKQNPDKKVLVITHSRDDVSDCEQHLWQKHGLDAAVFHEGMDLVERDSAAAYFADEEHGARVLLCSEIGSEGRNFQFSHHLVCLDLPEHPDLLEQRIGRLDRIGQQHDIHIHALVADETSDSAKRWSWFHEALNCVEYQNPAAGTVHNELWPGAYTDIDASIMAQAKKRVETLAEQIRVGRDALLEMNSCRQPQASDLAERIRLFEKDTPLSLVEQAANLLQFHFEDLGNGRYSLLPSDKMLIASLPGIPPEGTEVTFHRDIANAREDVMFITWDAPFIMGLWELLHHSELGSACVAMLTTRQLPPGKCLLEGCFDIVIQSEFASECLPFLNETSLRVVASELSDKDLAGILTEEQLEKNLKRVDNNLARQIIKSQKQQLPGWFDKAEHFAQPLKEQAIAAACEKISAFFAVELTRLKDLAALNRMVSDSDIEMIALKEKSLLQALQNNTDVHVSALRLIVTNNA